MNASLASAEKVLGAKHEQALGNLVPQGWRYVRLTSVAKLESGHTPSRRKPSYWSGDIPWVSLLDTAGLNGAVISATRNSVTREGIANSSARLLPAGTVIFSRTATVGKSTVMGREMATSQDFANYICGPEVHNHFLVYLFRHMAPEWRKLMAGSIHNTVYMPVFRVLEVLLPSLAEQVAIAKALSDTDTLVESLEQLLVKRRQIKQGAMQELLTGQRRLPGFDAKWKEKSLDKLFSFSGGHTASRDQLGSHGHCYLHYGDIHTSTKTCIELPGEREAIPKLDIALKKVSPNAMLAHGDVVFVDASEDDDGTSRHVVVSNPTALPFIAGLHTIVAKAKSNELDLLYRRHCFQTASVKAQFRFFAVGTKVSGVSKSNIRKITVLVPSTEEQAAIATTLSDIDAELTALEARLAKTRLLKQGVAQALLTGRIRLV